MGVVCVLAMHRKIRSTSPTLLYFHTMHLCSKLSLQSRGPKGGRSLSVVTIHVCALAKQNTLLGPSKLTVGRPIQICISLQFAGI